MQGRKPLQRKHILDIAAVITMYALYIATLGLALVMLVTLWGWL